MNSMKCHKSESNILDGNKEKIILVGQPNVGKSVIFNKLTKTYAHVSNYPGTTVAVERGITKIKNKEYLVLDTPGIYSLATITEEEKVTKKILYKENAKIVLHIVDLKNIDRMLQLTLELIESNLPLILVLNMVDEAEKRGIKVNLQKLEKKLKIPVVLLSATKNQGFDTLYKTISNFKFNKKKISVKKKFNYNLILKKQAKIDNIVKKTVTSEKKEKLLFSERLSRILMNPWTGFPIFFLIIYFGLYYFVGVFGAGTVVDFLETRLFEQLINPFVDALLTKYIPWAWFNTLIGGEYGIITFGIRYAIALILPIVTTYFFAFSIIEDSGYLPRLAMLIDNIFKKIGLNGRAVIPMVLGFGCDTMATIVTRTQETNKERIITTLLLALAIPCSAQLGVIFAILAGNPTALFIWSLVIILEFLLVGFLASKVIPGEKPYFYMDLPPLRIPNFGNILIKTYSRLEWYFKEVIPVFIIASVLIWVGKLTGIFNIVINALKPIVSLMGLPEKTAEIFLFGFFRRDYGAAGLYGLQNIMTTQQLVVATVTLTLFVPCIAQFSIMLKERGWKTTLGIVIFIFPFAFFTGYVLNLVLTYIGVLI